MATEARLATTPDVLNDASQHVTGLSTTQLASAVSTSLDGTTHLIQITAADPDAQRAADIANAIANALIARQQKVAQASNAPNQQQVQQQIDDTQHKIDALTAQLQNLQRDPQNQQSQIADVQSQLSALREQHALLQWTLAQLQVAQAQGAPTMLVAQQAKPSAHATTQSLTARAGYGAAGFFFGLAVGILIALAHDQVVRRRQQPAKVAVGGEVQS
jgi:capsular polysaccharide biosynthesis protein